MITSFWENNEEPRGIAVTKVRLGNFRPDSCEQFYIDFPHQMKNKHHEIRMYPGRCNDQDGNPIEDEWYRVMMGQSLVKQHGTFYAPREELELVGDASD